MFTKQDWASGSLLKRVGLVTGALGVLVFVFTPLAAISVSLDSIQLFRCFLIIKAAFAMAFFLGVLSIPLVILTTVIGGREKIKYLRAPILQAMVFYATVTLAPGALFSARNEFEHSAFFFGLPGALFIVGSPLFFGAFPSLKKLVTFAN